MQLRIAPQIALLIAAAVVLAVLAVGGVSLWNLRSGFGDYLRSRDEEQLTRLMHIVEGRAAQDPGMDWLRSNPAALREVMDEFVGRARPGPLQRLLPRPPPRPEPPDEPRPGFVPPDAPDRPPAARPPGPPPGPDDGPDAAPGLGPDGGPDSAPEADRPPPLPGVAGSLPQRVLVRDRSGQQIAGRRFPDAMPRSVRAIKVQGETVATLELVMEPQPEGLDARFLQRQYQGLAAAAAGTIALALLAGWWVARRWSRPLRALQATTRRIASGDLSAFAAGKGRAKTGAQGRAKTSAGAVEIDELVADVNAMGQSLAALETARKTWIAEISHELRTPLAVLQGELEAIEDGARQPTPPVIASLREEVLQLNRLVADLHTLAVADLGQLPCEWQQADANAALLRMAGRYAERARELGLVMEVLPLPHAVTANWDYGRVEQLLRNLLENSLRYTQSPGRLRVQWTADASQLTLRVQDSAPGLHADQYQRIFDPLYRADSARSRTGQHGSGLGLSIVRAIVQAHHGSVRATASDWGGLEVRVELPLQPGQATSRNTQRRT